MKRLLRFGSSAGLLGIAPLLVSVATFISVPLILGTLGPELWVSITIGQAIGEIARSLVVWGWNSIGLTIVAPMSRDEKTEYYFASLLPRFIVLIPVAAGVVIVPYLIPNADPESAIRMGFVGAIYGLTAGWYFISSNEPLKYVLCDALPRAASILVAALLLLAIPSVWVYGWINIAGSFVAVGLPYLMIRGRARGYGVPTAIGRPNAAFSALRRGLPIVGSQLVMVSRISFAVLAAPFIAPAQTATVALGDKFFRWANTGMTPVMQTLLVRIPRGDTSLVAKARRGLAIAWSGGVVIGAGATIVTYLLSGLISHGQINLGFSMAVPIGIAVMMLFIAGIGGNSVLVMFGRVRQVFSAGAIALVVLVVVSLLLAPQFGAVGIFWAFAASETSVVAYQSIVILSEFRKAKAKGGA